MSNGFTLDLGSATLMASTAGDATIYREPSVIAVNRRSGSILAVGKQALESPTDADVVLMRPFRSGLTSNFDITYQVMQNLLKRSFGKDLRGGRLLMSIPCSTSEAEEQALVDMAGKCGIKFCHLIYSPLAAMTAEFISPFSNCLLIDIGAVRTNIMTLSGGRILYMRTIQAGGENFDAALVEYLRRTYKVQISMKTAEQLKIKAGTVFNDGSTTFAPQTVSGKHMETGETISIDVTTEDMYKAFEDPLAELLDPICVTVMKIPIPYAEKVIHTGIILCGGGSALHGMDKMIEGVTGVPTTLAERPSEAVVRGLSHVLEWLPAQIPPHVRNVSGYYIEKFLSTK